MSLNCRWLVALVCIAGAISQPPPRDFELYLPDFFATPVDSGSTLIALPDRPIQRLRILAIDAAKRNIQASGIRVFVNGKGIGNILDTRGVEHGLMLTMDPATLNRRPDEIFDPRENTIEILASDTRQRRYYQSWILRSGGSQNPYFTYAGSVSSGDPEGIPPDLTIEEPRLPPVLPSGRAATRIAIRGTYSTAHPSLLLTLNGAPVVTAAAKSGAFEQKVEVKRGTSTLLLEATDQKQNRRTVIIPVLASQATPSRPTFAGTRYAFLVGISRYGDAKDAPPPVPGAAAAASQLATELEEKAGFRKENIRLLTDDGADPSRIRSGLFDFSARAKKDDLLLIFVAGHGLHDPRPGHAEKLYLAPFGAQLSQIDSTALSFDDFEMLLSRAVRCNHTFLIFDVGHSVDGDWKFAGRNLINNHLLNLFSEQEGRAVMVAGSADELSQETKGGASSVFAGWLARAMAGEADLNQDRVVTADEAFRFIATKVQEETGGSQNPRFRLPRNSRETALADFERDVTRK
jgi:hypothetical protein